MRFGKIVLDAHALLLYLCIEILNEKLRHPTVTSLIFLILILRLGLSGRVNLTKTQSSTNT